MSGEDAGGDPFDEWHFDDEFVRGAAVTEASAEERIERLRRIDADHNRLRTQRELDESLARARQAYGRDPGRRRRFSFSTFLIVATTIVIGIYAVKDGLFSDEGAEDAFLGTDGGGDLVVGGETEYALPAAPADEADLPLALPPAVTGAGPHAFNWTQADGVHPVAYDPCQPIHFVVNWTTAPTDAARSLVDTALADVSDATGLQFVDDGSTPERPTPERRSVLPDRYGDRWAPVLIAWSDPAEFPELAGDVLGAAGSSWIETPDGDRVYVSGVVALDGPELVDFAEETGDQEVIAATILHELGHLVGLDHVEDETQLMNPYAVAGVDSFGDGDRAGLSALGRGDCFPGV